MIPIECNIVTDPVHYIIQLVAREDPTRKIASTLFCSFCCSSSCSDLEVARRRHTHRTIHMKLIHIGYQYSEHQPLQTWQVDRKDIRPSSWVSGKMRMRGCGCRIGKIRKNIAGVSVDVMGKVRVRLGLRSDLGFG